MIGVKPEGVVESPYKDSEASRQLEHDGGHHHGGGKRFDVQKATESICEDMRFLHDEVGGMKAELKEVSREVKESCMMVMALLQERRGNRGNPLSQRPVVLTL